MLASLQRLHRVFRKPHWCVLAAATLSLMLSGICTLLMGIPIPRVHDEFAYLLGADTYASGRFSNPPHAMWQHFESFHILSQPSCMPKYPPGQALFMALGQLLGHPYVGVGLSSALAGAGLTWMLIAWVPCKYRWLCVLLAGLHPGLHIKWGHSYLGGAVALLAASLLLGALFRSLRSLSHRNSIIAAIGISLLAISRPFEGAILTLSVAFALLLRIIHTSQWRQAGLRVVMPAGLVLSVTVFCILFNNQRVTDDPLRLPYQVYEQQYGLTSLFLWQAPKVNPPSYRHAVFEKYYAAEDEDAQQKFSSLTSTVREKGKALADVIHFFAMGGEYLLLVCMPLAFVSRRFRLGVLLLIPALLAAAATPWTWTHYAAPAAPLIMMLLMLTLVGLLRWLDRRKLAGWSPALLTLAALLFAVQGWSQFQADRALNSTAWALRRQQLENELVSQPGLDLVVVSYTDKHNPHQEWVYNKANLDRAEVVWARSISPAADQTLVEYFSDRRVVYLQVNE